MFYWILIGSITGAVLVLVIIAGICGFKRNKTTGTPGFVFNDIDINPGGKFRLASMRRKRNNAASTQAKLEDNSERFEEITDQEEEPVRCIELEGKLSVGEQQALAAKRIE